MDRRVLSSQEALQAAQRMKLILEGRLGQLVQELEQHGQVLADPEHWDCPVAESFRSQHWPRDRRALAAAIEAIGQLQAGSERLVLDILRAGGGWRA
jgi:hypothetical protein